MRSAWVAVTLLAACASAPREEPPAPPLPERAGVDTVVAARAEGVDFRAVGAAFILNIYREERITLAWGDQNFSFPKPEPILPRWNGEIYETSDGRYALRVEIRRASCAGADGDTWPARVTVILDDEMLEGCGRSF